jgi:hypothetical protein
MAERLGWPDAAAEPSLCIRPDYTDFDVLRLCKLPQTTQTKLQQ